jgi:hypothetical protein
VPLQDRAEFREWLARRDEEDRALGRGEEDAASCTHCGVGRAEQAFHRDACLVCLAEQFGVESTEERIAGVVRTFVLAAVGDGRWFVRLFQEATWALADAADIRTTTP